MRVRKLRRPLPPDQGVSGGNMMYDGNRLPLPMYRMPPDDSYGRTETVTVHVRLARLASGQSRHCPLAHCGTVLISGICTPHAVSSSVCPGRIST